MGYLDPSRARTPVYMDGDYDGYILKYVDDGGTAHNVEVVASGQYLAVHRVAPVDLYQHLFDRVASHLVELEHLVSRSILDYVFTGTLQHPDWDHAVTLVAGRREVGGPVGGHQYYLNYPRFMLCTPKAVAPTREDCAQELEHPEGDVTGCTSAG